MSEESVVEGEEHEASLRSVSRWRSMEMALAGEEGMLVGGVGIWRGL